MSAAEAHSEDEFDAFPDVYAGVDLDSIPALAPVSPHPKPPSAASSEYEFDDLDDATLAEVDAIEARALGKPTTTADGPEIQAKSRSTSPQQKQKARSDTSLPTTPTLKARRGRHSPSTSTRTASDKKSPEPCTTHRTPPPKRPRAGPSSPPKKERSGASPTRKKPRVAKSRSASPPKGEEASSAQTAKSKEESSSQTVKKIWAELEDELSCPSCFNLFVCAHLGNPCGHSFCGQCIWDWMSKDMPPPSAPPETPVQMDPPTCPVCRAELSTAMPIIPNFTLDSTVRRHVDGLTRRRVDGWEPGGQRLLEWEEQHTKWKAGAARRAEQLLEMQKRWNPETPSPEEAQGPLPEQVPEG